MSKIKLPDLREYASETLPQVLPNGSCFVVPEPWNLKILCDYIMGGDVHVCFLAPSIPDQDAICAILDSAMGTNSFTPGEYSTKELLETLRAWLKSGPDLEDFLDRG